jgi:hypothetical protein
MRPKRPFTLLEFLFALFLIGSIGAIIGSHSISLLRKWEFQNDISRVVRSLREMQILALTYQTDLLLTFWHRDNSWNYACSSQEPFPSFLFDTTSHKLKSINRIVATNESEKVQSLQIYADGSIEPAKALAFFRFGSKNPDFVLDCTGGFSIRGGISREKN